ncbi:hypothetical protein F511_09672 [Dorcoceras hygrometricum]|uniref:Uncharacterized protein n=1 Tax=Dorcoceras hygrometricum TaxID=472368 RepID=A0A2Z7AG02_9LAMI|nr:hypothetical protein F511_09672 [Dorcoceras hygrometricum]
MKRRRLEISGSACKISRCLRVDLYRVGYGVPKQMSTRVKSERRKRRRLDSAKEPVDAHIRFPDVNAGQLFCSLQLETQVLQLVVVLAQLEVPQEAGTISGEDRRRARQRKNNRIKAGRRIKSKKLKTNYDIHRMFKRLPCWHLCLAPTGITRTRLFSVDCGSLRKSGPRPEPRLLRQAALEALTRSARTNTPRKTRPEQFPAKIVGGAWAEAAAATCVTLNGSGIQLAVGPQPLRLRNHNSGLAQRIMVKRLATSPHDPLGITDSACKNQSVVVSEQYGPFNPYIPIRSTIIGKSRVGIDPIAMYTSWRSNSDITSVTSIGYPRMSASGESSTTMHRLLHASGSHPIPTPNDPKTNQYNQDLGLIHSTNGNHLESPNEGSSIDNQVTIYLHAQNITMFPTNETLYFASQILVSNSGGLILILTAQSTRNMFRMHSDY